MFYNQKHDAEQAADALELSCFAIAYTKVELEPGNGWAIVAVPKVIDITYLKGVEIRHPAGHAIVRLERTKRIVPFKKTNAPTRPRMEVIELVGDQQLPKPWET